jgi:hypothetical protein
VEGGIKCQIVQRDAWVARGDERTIEAAVTHVLTTKHVYRPKVLLADGGPKTFEQDTLSIVHVALGRVITENAVDQDLFFSLVEPSVLSSQDAGSVGRAWS